MNAPRTVTANFAVSNANVTILTSPAGLQVSVDGGTAQAAPVKESWQVGSKHAIATVSPQGSNGTQYTFAGWSDGGALSHSVTVPGSAAAYTASFNTSYLLTLSASPSGDGTATATTKGRNGCYATGTVVNIAATPGTGFNFTNWTGNVANSTNAFTTVAMSSPQTLTANFVAGIANVTTSVSITATPLVYNRATKTFNTTYTITNTGLKAITGPTSLALSGLATGITVSTPPAGAASAFNISFYASDGATPILTTDTADGIAGQIILNGDGSTSVDTIPATTGGVSALTITPLNTVPEPGYTVLLTITLCGGMRFYKRSSISR